MMKTVMYHYVRFENKDYPSFQFLHFNDFQKQLDYFSENYTILHPHAIQEAIENKYVKPGIVLTFDDGVKDHYSYVFPELQKRGVYGIFYISTGVYQTGKMLDVHRIHVLLGRFGADKVYSHLMKIINNEMLTDAHVDDFRNKTYNRTDTETLKLVKRILNYYISYEHRHTVIDKLVQFFFEKENILQDFYLSPDEIKIMHNAGMIFGSHTVSHPLMSKLSVAEQQTEITASFNYLDEVTGGLNYKTFCYPYGGFHSFTAETEQILSDNKCLYSFNVEPRDISADDIANRPQALPRYDCNHFPHGQIWQK